MKRNAGFTLVEMMIVLAIMAILLAVGIPAFRSTIENAKIRTTVETLQGGLQLARNEAMRRNVDVSLWLVNDLTAACIKSSTGPSWVVSQNDPAGSCADASSDTDAPRIIQTRDGRDGSTNLNIAATDQGNAASSCITFNGFGGVRANCPGGGNPITRITVQSASTTAGTRTLEVRITDGGATRMCDPTPGNTSATAC